MEETSKRTDFAFLLFAIAFHARLSRAEEPPAGAPSQREALAAAAAQDARAGVDAFVAAFGEDALP